MSELAIALGGVAAALVVTGAAASFALPVRRRGVGLGLLLGGWILAVLAILPGSLEPQRWILAGALLAGIAVAWLLEPLLRGRERWLLVAGAGAAIFRVPVPTGEGTAMLLLPVYAVIGIGVVAMLRRSFCVPAGTRGGPAEQLVDRGRATRLLDGAVLAQPALAAASFAWSDDRAATAETLAFFHIPFVLGFLLVRRWVRRGVDLRAAWTALLIGVGVAALIGILQAVTHDVWWNDKVIDANRFRGDFRTNSLFWDPNIFGRALVFGILAVTAASITRATSARASAAVTVGAAVLLAALWTTFSQSSWFALAAGLAALGLLTLPPRIRRWAAGTIAIACLVATPFAVDALRGRDASGRLDVVRAGAELAESAPLLGHGAGAFEEAAIDAARDVGRYNSRLTASHTTPVTVAAELGALGAIAYLTLLGAATATILARWRRSSTPAAAARRRSDPDAGTGWPTPPVVWATGAFVALVAHSLLYAAFYEDPLLWAALGILASLPAIDPSGRPVE